MERTGMIMRTRLIAGALTVYGRHSCPWTEKQLENLSGKDYTFVDCDKETCPSFVKGVPTTVIEGYHPF